MQFSACFPLCTTRKYSVCNYCISVYIHSRFWQILPSIFVVILICLCKYFEFFLYRICAVFFSNELYINFFVYKFTSVYSFSIYGICCVKFLPLTAVATGSCVYFFFKMRLCVSGFTGNKPKRGAAIGHLSPFASPAKTKKHESGKLSQNKI
jgi:hypothetical protein